MLKYLIAAILLVAPVSADAEPIRVTGANIIGTGDEGFLFEADVTAKRVTRKTYAFCSPKYPVVMYRANGKLQVERVSVQARETIQPVYSMICYDSPDWRTQIRKGGYSPAAFDATRITRPTDMLALP